MVEQKRELMKSLKRKAGNQNLSSTRNLLTEALATADPHLIVCLPKLESLARVVRGSRAKVSESAPPHSVPELVPELYPKPALEPVTDAAQEPAPKRRT